VNLGKPVLLKLGMTVVVVTMQSSSQIITTNKPTSNFLQAGCPSCRPTNNVEALEGDIMLPYLYFRYLLKWLILPETTSEVVWDRRS